ncbi:MAG TPA: hypothetical protein VEK57_05795, partial [Thermoanaerobaculia bacterium]|nr:hypothetical protein [Thermoanaerobaculia bacterium]
MSGGEAAARAGWRAAVAIGKLAEDVAALPVPGETARAFLLGIADALAMRGNDGGPPAGGPGPRRLFSLGPRSARPAPVQ